MGAQRLIAGRWVPAVPIKAPIDVRWCCSHEWTPHVFPEGRTSSLDYDCLRCGTGREFGAWPDNGPDRFRRRLAGWLFPHGRATRKSSVGHRRRVA